MIIMGENEIGTCQPYDTPGQSIFETFSISLKTLSYWEIRMARLLDKSHVSLSC